MPIDKKIYSIKTNYGSFMCLFEREKDMGGYTVEALQIQGAVSWGKNLTQARNMIAEAIEGAIETRVLARAKKEGIIRVVHPTFA